MSANVIFCLIEPFLGDGGDESAAQRMPRL